LKKAGNGRNNEDFDIQNRSILEVWVKIRYHRVKAAIHGVKLVSNGVELLYLG
jgi:hypothetical protein